MRIYTKEQARGEIERLVNQFARDEELLIADKAKEELVETKYIRPLFDSLNWNTRNEGILYGSQEFYIRYSQKVKKTTEEPDYLLRVFDSKIERMRNVLFIETKRPEIELSKSLPSIRQAYRYAHNTLNLSDYPENRVRLALLTDFQEFRLFDCQDPYPLIKDDATVDLFNKYVVSPFDWNYENYVKDFDLLWETFERNNVRAGSLDDYRVTEEDLKKKRVAPDVRFLEELKEWRLEFARSMYKTREGQFLSERVLTAASQLMVNRLIFLKMLADRGIEKDYLTLILEELEKNGDGDVSLYDSCRHIFKELEMLYDGDVFERRVELDHVRVENKVLKSVLEVLRPERSVYTMAAMPVEVIGNIYENFLGEVIKKKGRGLTRKSKREYRKAIGAFYTPRYIVDYIIDNTLGMRLEECKNPADVSKIKILDPACGSGSFLVGAYEKLLNWHVDYFRNQVSRLLKKGKEGLEVQKKLREYCKIYFFSEDGDNDFILHLSSKLKKGILCDNIYGVDIDPQAVEVARFSLSMKALEDATREELYEDRNLFDTTILANLKYNIKCGNSLIGSDYFEGQLKPDEEERRRVNPFDWEVEFEEIMKAGGFDAVIGNPPWVQSKYLEKVDKNYYESNYVSAAGQYDVFNAFIERGEKVLGENGHFGFIIPSRILMNPDYIKLREFLSRNVLIVGIVDVGEHIFEGVEMPAMLLFYRKPTNKKSLLDNQISVKTDVANLALGKFKSYSLPQKRFVEDEEFLFTIYQEEALHAVIRKVEDVSVRFGEIVKNARGVEIGKKSPLVSEERIEGSVPFLVGEDMGRYYIKNNHYLKLGARKVNYKTPGLYEGEKIIIRKTGTGINATLDKDSFYVIQVIYIFKKKEPEYNYRYLLGILNSKLMGRVYFAKFGEENKQAFPHLRQTNVLDLPIRRVDFSTPADVARHDNMVALVEEMLALHKRLAAAKSDADRTPLERAIEYTDGKIDELVWELYGLTREDKEVIGVLGGGEISTDKSLFFDLLGKATQPVGEEEA